MEGRYDLPDEVSTEKNARDHYDQGNTSIEIKRIKKSIFSFSKDADIEKHEWKNGITYKAAITRNGKPSILGWKMIRLALLGKSWRYMERVTGIKKSTISYVFRTNPVIRQAVLDLASEVVEESKAILLRGLQKSAISLVKLAAGESELPTADKMKVQLEAIKEHFNRIGFAIPVPGRGGGARDTVIRIEGPEAHDLGLLISRRRELAEGKGGDVDADGDSGEGEEEAGQEGSRSGDDGSVAESRETVIEGEFTEQSA